MPAVPFIVVGTQIDLREDENIKMKLAKRRQRPQTQEDGERFSKRIGAYAYVECSALTRQGLKDVFDEAMLAVLDPVETKPEKRTTKKRRKCTIL